MPTRAEIEFIKSWVGLAGFEPQLHVVRGRLPPSSTHDFSRFENSVGGVHRWVLTPRGADLVATARGLDLNTLTADDEPTAYEPPEPWPDCPDCEGRGRIPVGFIQRGELRDMKELVEGSDGRERDPAKPEVLAGWDVGCTTCKGRGKVPASSVEVVLTLDGSGVFDQDDYASRLAEELRMQQRESAQPRQPGANPWSSSYVGPVDFIEVASKFSDRAGMAGALTIAEDEGLEVEVTWTKTQHCSLQSPHSGQVKWGGVGYPQIGYQLFDDVGRGTTIPELTSVKILRPKLDDWAREPEAITALLREAQKTGREIEAEWVGGEKFDVRVTGVSGESEKRPAWSLFVIGHTRRFLWFGMPGENPYPYEPVLTAVRFKATTK